MAQAQQRRTANPRRKPPKLVLVHDRDAPAQEARLDDVFFDKSQIKLGVPLLNIGVREGGSEWVVVRITTHKLGDNVGVITEGIPAKTIRFLSDPVTARKVGTRVTVTRPFGSFKYSACWRLKR